MVRVAFANNRRKHINTGVQIAKRSEWCRGAVVHRADAVALNATIGGKVAEVQRAIASLEAQNIEVTVEALTDALNPQSFTGNFIEYMEHRIEERNLRANTKRNHLTALAALKDFGKINSFASLTVENIMLFDRYLKTKDRKQTTIRGYHKCIKPYIAELVMARKIKENPYNYYKVPRGSAKVRNPLTEAELNKILTTKLPPIYDRARDIFIFQAYTGLSYADAMAFDADVHLVEREGRSFISHERTKTNTKYYTPILPHADAILLKYGSQLPRLSNQKYNQHLHAIEGICGIDKPLTSHVARHSFATLMLSHDVPIAVVSRMLGHTDIGVTQLYAKITSEKVESSTTHLWEELE